MRTGIGAVLMLIFVAVSPAATAQQITPEPEQAAAPTTEALATLSPQERTELLSRLSDEQARSLLSEYLKAAPGGMTSEGDMAIEQLEARSELFRQNFKAVLMAAPQLSQVPAFVYERLGDEGDPWRQLRVALYLVITLAIAFGVERLALRSLSTVRKRLTSEPGGDFLGRFGRACGLLLIDLTGLAVFAAFTLIVFFMVYEGHEPTRLFVLTMIAAVLLFRIVLAISRMLFMPATGGTPVVPLDDATARIAYRYMAIIAAIGTFGFLGCDLILLLGLAEAPHGLLSFGVGTLFVAMLIAGIWRVRKGVAAVLSGNSTEGATGGPWTALAALWHLPVIVYIAVVYVLAIFNAYTDGVSGTAPGVMSLLLVAVLPLADRILCSLVDRFSGAGDETTRSSRQVLRRATHILIALVAVVALAAIWRADLFSISGTGIGGRVARAALDIALTVFVGYLAWGLLKATLMKHIPEGSADQAGGDESGAGGATRLATVLPLFMRMAQISIIVMVVMVVLSALGVNIGPLLAGAGVIGIAIGFGAQTLVRDVVSGLFFLLDDAFRRGEYVDLGGIKGTVEKINVRSLALRHHLGMLHTVPYGEIQHLTNFSRDWVIMKLEFRVSYDTDPDKVKKIFKRIGQEMLEHPELGKNFIEPFKSQGVKAMEESAMIVRGKFMAKPGTQFTIRKELYNRVQKAFQENGIEFAHRRVMVDLPHDLDLPAEKKQEIAEAAAAGAVLEDKRRERAGS